MEILVALAILYFVSSTLMGWMKERQERQAKSKNRETGPARADSRQAPATGRQPSASRDTGSTLFRSDAEKRLGRTLAEQPDWQQTYREPDAQIAGEESQKITQSSLSTPLQAEDKVEPVHLASPKTTSKMPLHVNQAIEGMIWSEIYAPPRARRPHHTSAMSLSRKRLR